ncbi:glycosyltransferase family 4 protein [Staphylococcus pseudintermedius]|uniref:glycosyltransferase family 4 protein n=1 Tax=Staphylococcus pseudintermedius TaxID=283734 RepID=UPI0018EF36FB|nr:glycosyltransferase family 4 protein [Staphylococcus pseudintermedius]QQJ53321.1 glycosyltransferase family 4 protein [Staphylococcus pseudintermedius]
MKNIWIMNHYATDQYFNEGGRHYWFAQYLKKQGYKVTIFCANTRHNSNEMINTDGKEHNERIDNGITFVFVKSHAYKTNNHHRIFNMITFAKRLITVAEEYRKRYGQPDVILASSVHPLTLMAGLKIAKKWNIKCVVEIRDLWPESIVAYNILSEKNPFVKLMYYLEKTIYKKADSIIMTWPGGYEYIKSKGWGSQIPKEKVYHISNGVVLSDFYQNAIRYNQTDEELLSREFKTFVYTGSIRKVNDLSLLIDAAYIIEKQYPEDKIRVFIYGDGDEKGQLLEKVNKLKLKNILFKGKIPKKFVPFILKNAYANILHNRSTRLNQYGQSQNKLFEYLAAGRPIIQTYTANYSVVENSNSGICVTEQSPQKIADAMVQMARSEKLASEQGKNAFQIVKEYDFKYLTKKLIQILDS